MSFADRNKALDPGFRRDDGNKCGKTIVVLGLLTAECACPIAPAISPTAAGPFTCT